MSDLVDDVTKQMEDRLRKLEGPYHEYLELKEALDRIKSGNVRPASRSPHPRKGPPRTRAKGRRKAGTDRQGQVKAFLAQKPGSRPKDVADQLAISSAQVSGILKRLKDKGEVKKTKKGWQVT